MQKLFQQTRKSRTSEPHDKWLMGVTGIVADNQDPERQHRVRVVIPSIDEDLIYDEWARQMVFCLGNGYGTAFIPPVNSEVVLFGALGQKFNLFYASLYNEEMAVPSGFDSEMNAGFHVPNNLTMIAEAVAKLLAGDVLIQAQNSAQMLANQVKIAADGTAEINGNTIKFNADGSLEISGGNVKVNGNNVSISASGSVKIENRLVKEAGPPI